MICIGLLLACTGPHGEPKPGSGAEIATRDSALASTGSSASSESPASSPTDTSVDSSSSALPVISPAVPRDYEALECRAEGPISWTVDGVSVPYGESVPSGVVRAGQTWTCSDRNGLQESVTVETWGGNLLVVVMDDVGVDKVAAYGEHPQPPRTPVVDSLASQGLRFTRAYAHPYCSATRATMLTGRHPSRTGIGYVIDVRLNTEVELPLGEVTLAEVLASAGYATAAFGKWHLAGWMGPSGLQHPMLQGFTHFQGAPGNLNRPLIVDGPGTYTEWDKNDRGELRVHTEYATTDTVNDAVAHLADLPEPWLMWVGFNAGHSPFHQAPYDLAGPPGGEEVADLYDSMITAMDTELGRLLAALEPDVRERTTIVVMGDNGTPMEATRAPWRPSSAKGTLREGGVRVPLVVTGPMVSPGVSDALVHAADVFALASELVGAPVEGASDAVSPLPVLVDSSVAGGRDHVWFEQFMPVGPGPYSFVKQGVSDGSHKLVRENGVEEFFVLEGHEDGPPLDTETLPPDAAAAHARLQELLESYDALEFGD